MEVMMEFENTQVGALGLIGMRGCEELTASCDSYLRQWDIANGGDGHSVQVRAVCPRFTTGEAKGLIEQSVRGYDLYIICDVFNYGVSYKMYNMTVPMSPDDHYQDLKRIIMATNGKARRITVFMPMLYEGRQHRRFARESLDCAVALQELAAMGVDNLITFDAHDARVQNAIPLHGFENVAPTYQMIKALVNTVPDLAIDPAHMMIISPDEGAMSRCIYYSSVLGLDLGMFYKRRDYTKVVNGRNPILSHEYLGDDIKGKDVIIAEDIIASGDSMLSLTEQIKERGARRVFVFVTFGLFCDGLEAFDKAHENGVFEKVFTTNLIYRSPELRSRKWYHQVDMSKYISYIISTLNYDRSISDLLDPAQRIRKVLAQSGIKTP